MSPRRSPSSSSAQAPEEPAPAPRVVIRPPGEPEQERQERARKYLEAHGEFLVKSLSGRRVSVASAEDVRQESVMVLVDHVDAGGQEPSNVRKYLLNVAQRLLANRWRGGSLDVDRGAEVEDAVASSGDDPERTAERAERWRRLARHMDKLSEAEAHAFRCVGLEGDIYEKAAEKLGWPLGTVITRFRSARRKLEAFVLESDRAAEARLAALDGSGRAGSAEDGT